MIASNEGFVPKSPVVENLIASLGPSSLAEQRVVPPPKSPKPISPKIPKIPAGAFLEMSVSKTQSSSTDSSSQEMNFVLELLYFCVGFFVPGLGVVLVWILSKNMKRRVAASFGFVLFLITFVFGSLVYYHILVKSSLNVDDEPFKIRNPAIEYIFGTKASLEKENLILNNKDGVKESVTENTINIGSSERDIAIGDQNLDGFEDLSLQNELTENSSIVKSDLTAPIIEKSSKIEKFESTKSEMITDKLDSPFQGKPILFYSEISDDMKNEESITEQKSNGQNASKNSVEEAKISNPSKKNIRI